MLVTLTPHSSETWRREEVTVPCPLGHTSQDSVPDSLPVVFGELVRSFSLALGIPQIPACLQTSFRPDSPLKFFSMVLSSLENVWQSVFYNNSLHSIY